MGFYEEMYRSNHKMLREAEEERDRYREALQAIEIYARPPHKNIAEACGIDACTACLIYGTAQNALQQ